MAYASFKTRIGDLTGFASTDDTALSDWINDGIRELINSFSNDYDLLAQCATKQSTFTSAAIESEAHALNTGKVLTVYMTDSGATYPCRKINPNQKYYYADGSSFASAQMEQATVTDPVYYVQNNFINAIPSGKTVGYSEVQFPVADLTAGTSGISGFPDEAEHLVVLYASTKSIQQMMSNKTANLPSDISFPSIPVAPSVPSFDTGAISVSSSAPTYTSPVFSAPTLASVGDLTLPVIPTVPTLSAQSVTITGTAPTYVKPTSPSQTAFNSYWTLGDFGDSDPDALSISAVVPSTPSLTSVTFTSIDSSLDTVAPSFTTATISSASTYTGSAPAFTKPVVSPDFSQVNTYIDTDEDVELAQAKLQEINAQVSEYSTNIQNEQAEFNRENVLYQSAIQESMQEVQISNQVNLAKAQSDLQVATSNKDRDLQRQLQNGTNDMQAIINDNSRKISLYQAEVQTYQADVSKQVQEYTQKLSRYQLELNTVYTAWAKTESDNLAKYQADIQNELNTFNDSNVEYQAKLQKDIQDAQLSDSNEARKLQKYSSEVQTYSAEVNSKIQEWVNEEWTQNFQKYQQDYSGKLQEHGSNLQDALNKFNKENTVFQNDLQEQIQEANNQQTKDSSEYSAKLQKYSNEMQSYSAEVNKSVQDFNTKLQKHSTDYQWLQSQYAQLKSDYNVGLQLLLGRPLAAGEQQRR